MSRLRVVNISLPKTGTTTLASALRRAGLTVADWRLRDGQTADADIAGEHLGRIIYDDYFAGNDPLARLEAFDVINEMSAVHPGRSLWPQTDWGVLSAIRQHHPGVKFILSVRDPFDTEDSIRRWNNLGTRRLPRANVPGLPQGFGRRKGEIARWVDGHYRFCRQVFDGDADFLEYQIADTDAPRKIEAFLGVKLTWWGRRNATPDRSATSSDAGAS